MAKFKENIDVISVFKEVLKLNNVLMLDRSVNFNLTHELLLRSAFGKRGLENYFSGCDRSSLLTSELVAFREATFSKEFALDISAHLGFTGWLNDSLLDNGWNSRSLRIGAGSGVVDGSRVDPVCINVVSFHNCKVFVIFDILVNFNECLTYEY